jgi:hypothetical protein
MSFCALITNAKAQTRHDGRSGLRPRRPVLSFSVGHVGPTYAPYTDFASSNASCFPESQTA